MSTTTVNPNQTIADRIKAGIRTRVAPKPVRTTVPATPGAWVTYRTDGTAEDTARWVEAAEAIEGKISRGVGVACAMLAELCVSIDLDGEQWLDDAGRPVTFASTALHEVVGTDVHIDAVRAFYGRDVDLLAASDLVGNHSPGIVSKVAADPTRGSSPS